MNTHALTMEPFLHFQASNPYLNEDAIWTCSWMLEIHCFHSILSKFYIG